MEKELQKTFTDHMPIDIPQNEFFDLFHNFEEFELFMMMYNCAIREVKTKFEVLNDDLAVTNNRNPIEMIKSRVKKPESIFNKLKRKNLPISMESILENLNDVAGIRVICSFVDDIYIIAKTDLKMQSISNRIEKTKACS